MTYKQKIWLPLLSLAALSGSAQAQTAGNNGFTSGYSVVNGLKMYYEIHGSGKPLVVLHGGGSTIQTTFGRILGELAQNRQVIAVELQSHGRTEDIDRPLSFEQDADDVAGLLKNLEIGNADFFGFSNGGSTAMQIAIRHPNLVNKLVVASAMAKRSGLFPGFFEMMKNATLENMPPQYQQAYREVAPDASKLIAMHNKCRDRMLNFKDMSDDHIRSIKVPVLLIAGDKDVVTPEHAVELYRMLPNCSLAILPGGHGDYIGEITTLKDTKPGEFPAVPLIESFLEQSSGGR